MKRMRWCALGLVGALTAAALVGCAPPPEKSEAEAEKVESYVRPEKVEPKEARELLQQGNERFITAEATEKDISAERREVLADGQAPFAVVVTCSDSRVPPELVFDQALGDIFVVRVAGNVVDPVGLGSIEYAVEHLKVPLVVVLGHEGCGAVKAAAEGGKTPGSIGAIIRMIQPALATAKKAGLKREMLVEETIDGNIVNQLKVVQGSPVIREKLKEKELLVIGAKYGLESGEVEWVD